MDIIRPANGLLLMKVQTAEGAIATLSPLTDVVPCEVDSIIFTGPFKREAANEANGSLVASAPLIIGQPGKFRFRSRVKGANAAYSASVKPPLHTAFVGCGLLGRFTAAVAAASLAAGTATSATLATGAGTTPQMYRGMPLLLTAGPAIGGAPLITDYTAGKVATLSDSFSPALTTTTTAGIPANWNYAGTSPRDAASRNTQQPYVTIGWYEDGTLHQWMDCKGVMDLEGDTSKPAFAAFDFTGTYLGKTDAAMPGNAVIAGHSAPSLVQPVGAPPAMLVNRLGLPISKWSLKNGGQVETQEDPNTPNGYGAGQIGGREPMFEADPMANYVAVRDIQAQIAAFNTYPIALRFGTVANNRWSLLLPLAQPVEFEPGMRGAARSETTRWQGLSPGRDDADRDGDVYLTFY